MGLSTPVNAEPHLRGATRTFHLTSRLRTRAIVCDLPSCILGILLIFHCHHHHHRPTPPDMGFLSVLVTDLFFDFCAWAAPLLKDYAYMLSSLVLDLTRDAFALVVLLIPLIILFLVISLLNWWARVQWARVRREGPGALMMTYYPEK
ncbi:hypothetical protein BC834DRAFT_910885 [Gloeopeniophorella convolvens]|nr:hypothetical protein BC834DRAFT_910885 [Gloeopeniophorella convolvens]